MTILGVGAYAPRFRLSADAVRETLDVFRAPGIETVATPDVDEDAVTMAWEASTRALNAAGIHAPALDGLYLASTTLPTADESQVPRLVTALGATEHVDARQFSGSSAAGGEALASALESRVDGPILVVASDAPTGQPGSPEAHAAGAGAAAVVVDTGGASTMHAHGTATGVYPGTRFRPGDGETQGLGITTYTREAYATVLERALDDVPTDDLDAVAMTMPDGKLPYRAAGAAGLDTGAVAAAETVSTLGDTGAAGPFLGLATAISRGEPVVLLVAYGSGGTCHAFRLETAGVAVETSLDGRIELDYGEAMRRRGAFSGGEPAGGGANVPMPTYRSSLSQRYRLVAGACRECGTLAFPPEHACRECGARAGYDAVDLPRTGRISTSTVIGSGGAPPEFVDYQDRRGAYGTALVEFSHPDDTGRSVDIPLQVVLDGGGSLEIGDHVTTVFRVLYDQHGVRRYAAKAIPVDSRQP